MHKRRTKIYGPHFSIHSLSLKFSGDASMALYANRIFVLEYFRTPCMQFTTILHFGMPLRGCRFEIVRLQYRRGGKGGHSKNRGVLVLTHMSPRHEMRVGAIACTHVPMTYVPSFRATSPQIQSVACRGGAQESCSSRRPHRSHLFTSAADRAADR